MLINVAVLVTGIASAAAPEVTQEFAGKVIGVVDGDTIKVLVGKETVTVRLDGIDSPESGQAFGKKSQQALADLVAGKTVQIRKTGADKYDRTLGIVLLDGVDVNAKMIEGGWAWHFVKYNDEQRLHDLEIAAREAKRGLWADSNALAPWEYRARQTESRASPQGVQKPSPKPSLKSSQQPAPKVEQKPDPKAEAPSSKEFWLNTASNVRHNRRCQYYNNTKKGRFCGPTDGKACGVCGG